MPPPPPSPPPLPSPTFSTTPTPNNNHNTNNPTNNANANANANNNNTTLTVLLPIVPIGAVILLTTLGAALIIRRYRRRQDGRGMRTTTGKTWSFWRGRNPSREGRAGAENGEEAYMGLRQEEGEGGTWGWAGGAEGRRGVVGR
ncbi:MAG: hypothetical protein M1830_008109 [Pleopsidium flavum]|nr:MAG: hypothetical protein M1830_008109 [Pleopsidium flavum]